MKTLTKFIYFGFASVALACFALLPTVQAVVPAPDGGYPGGNTAEGQNALFSLTSGGYNTAVGFLSLRTDTTNSFNTALGAGALFVNTADQNTATGAAALFSNTAGSLNTATGTLALFSNTTGPSNTATGANALFANTSGRDNTAVGANALGRNVGDSNTAVGSGAGLFLTTGHDNICIGGGEFGSDGESSTIHIGDFLPLTPGDAACYIGGIAGQSVDPVGSGPVYIDNNDKLGVFQSSRRFKRDIQPMESASEAILNLKPVTFHYKSDKKNTPCFGLVAEDVAEVSPELVARDKEGNPYSVRYDQVNAMLLNEFLKEHRKVEQLTKAFESKFTEQQKQIEALTAGLEKVSAQLELSKSAQRTVLNNQ